MGNIASYSTLNKYVILSGTPVTTTTTATVGAISPTPLYGSSPTATGVINITGANRDNANAGTAQNELTQLVTAIEGGNPGFPITYTPLTSPIPGSTLTLTPGNYKVTGDLTFSNVTLNFNGSSQNYYIWATGQIIFTSGTINLNGVSASTIYWRAGSAITNATVITNGLPGIFIAQSSITINAASVITGNLYAQTGNVTLVGNRINPQTLCYLKGTKILTQNGFTNVEDLKVGDCVISYGSISNNTDVQLSETVESKPIKWVSNFHAVKRDSSDIPVCFKAGSLGENAPFNDLFVSPGHRVIIDGKMVVASEAVNDETIVQEDTFDAIEYYHFELDEHSLVMAEGVLAETFLEVSDTKSSFL